MAQLGRTKADLRSQQIGRAFDRLQIMIPSMDLWQVRIALGRLEHELVPMTRGAHERRELRRRVIERYVNICLERRASWRTTRRAIRRLDEVGYTILDQRMHVAILLSYYAVNIVAARDFALARIRDAM